MKQKNLDLFSEILGWYGCIAILGAYGFVSFSLIAAEGLVYQFLNITGSVGLLIIAYRKKVYQSVLLNIIWAIIGIVAVIRIYI